MGCSPFKISSSQTPDCKREPASSFPNPDPSNYKILEVFEKNAFLLIKIRYPDCINYEGDKILLYQNINLSQLKAQKYIDPHFTNSKIYASPIARFEPTLRGWEMGRITIDAYLKVTNKFW